MKRINLILVLILLSTACRSVRRGDPITGPLNQIDATVQRGQLVFQEHCYQCHPGGEGGLGPSLNDKPAPVWLMKIQVRAGLGTMPGFNEDSISSEEIDDLMKYVIALRKDK